MLMGNIDAVHGMCSTYAYIKGYFALCILCLQLDEGSEMCLRIFFCKITVLILY